MPPKQSEAVHSFFPSLKENFIAYRSSKLSSRPDCNFEIHQLWQSGFSRVYSNCCCSCSFEPEIIKIGWSSHKMYSNNTVNFQESRTILNAHTKKVLKLIICTLHIHLYIHTYIHIYITLWPINCGVLTSLLLSHLSSSLIDSLPSLNLLFHSKTHARFMPDGRKAV